LNVVFVCLCAYVAKLEAWQALRVEVFTNITVSPSSDMMSKRFLDVYSLPPH